MLSILPDGIRISPSNKGRCSLCGNFIGKGEPRLEISYPYKKSMMTKDLYCYKCSETRIDTEIKKIKNDLESVEKMKITLKEELAKEGMDKLLLANKLHLNEKLNEKLKGKMWIS